MFDNDILRKKITYEIPERDFDICKRLSQTLQKSNVSFQLSHRITNFCVCSEVKHDFVSNTEFSAKEKKVLSI